MTPAVTFTREVNPLWMTELITHKVEISTIDGRCRDKSNHLMKGDTAMNCFVFITFLEMPVHVGINKAEDNRFITDKGLVVAFAIRNRLLVGPSVLHFPEDATGFPVFIAKFLDGLYPIVWDIHRHAIVEAIASIFVFSGKAWHTTYFFGYSDSMRIHFMDEFVGKCQVADGIVIFVTIKVITIAAEGFAQTMTIIEHGGNSIETETIKMEFFQPILTVGKQEV